MRTSAAALALLFIACAALAQERPLIDPHGGRLAENVIFGGAATDGKRTLFAWSYVDDATRKSMSYVQFDDGRAIRLNTGQMPAAVVRTPSSFYVIVVGEGMGHIIPVSFDGVPGAPLDLGMPERYFVRAVSNGDGFIVVAHRDSDSKLHARLFDRNAAPQHEITWMFAPIFDVTTRGSDYVVRATTGAGKTLWGVVIHPNGTTQIASMAIAAEPVAVTAANEGVTVHHTLMIAGHEIALGDTYGFPRLAWDGSNYLVMMPDGVRRYSPDGTLLGTTPGDYPLPVAIVPRPNAQPLLFWYTEANNRRALHVSGGIVTESVAPQTAPAASSDGKSTIVAWREPNGLAATVFRDLDEPRRIVAIPGSASTTRIATISVRGVHYVVWADDDAVRLVRIDANGTLLDAQPKLIATTKLDSWVGGPAMATNGKNILVTWSAGNSIVATPIALNGVAGKPMVVAAARDDDNMGIQRRGRFAALPWFDGRGYRIAWIEQPALPGYDMPFPPFEIRIAKLNGEPRVVGTGMYANRVVVTPSRILWQDYRVPFFGPWGKPAKIPPSFLAFKTAPLNGGPETEIAKLERPDWKEQPALDVALLGDRIFWTESTGVMAMRIGDKEPQHIAEASNGSLRVVPEMNLLVYARDVDGVSRIFIRR